MGDGNLGSEAGLDSGGEGINVVQMDFKPFTVEVPELIVTAY